MLPTVVYVIDTIIRALKKGGRAAIIVADSFYEAQDFRKASRGKYPHIEE